jgi:hypothetical protein
MDRRPIERQRCRYNRGAMYLKEMSCVKNVYVLYVYCYIVVACIFIIFLTVAIFPATYIQQLGRSLQKNEKLFTVCLSRSNFALIHLPQRNTPLYGTHHLCVATLTTKHILTVPRPRHWAGPSNSDQLNLLRGGGVEDNRTKTFPSLLSFTGVKGQ